MCTHRILFQTQGKEHSKFIDTVIDKHFKLILMTCVAVSLLYFCFYLVTQKTEIRWALIAQSTSLVVGGILVLVNRHYPKSITYFQAAPFLMFTASILCVQLLKDPSAENIYSLTMSCARANLVLAILYTCFGLLCSPSL